MRTAKKKNSKICCQKCLLGTVLFILILFLLLFVVVFIVLPFVFKYSIGMQRLIVFPTYIISPGVNYSDVDQFGIKGVQNFYVTFANDEPENITLGVWQILPSVMLSDVIRNEDYNYDGVLANGNYKILIYLHGNGQDRAESVKKFLILRDYFHIFSIDYRGYADSTKAELTETKVVNDMVQFYEWLQNRTSSKIFVWGHSLGTGVGTHLLANLKEKGVSANGLVLETPFTSVTDVMADHFLVKALCGWLPWFKSTIIEPMIDNDFNFDSNTHIKNVDCPIMILHAKDDTVIPYKFATKLYETAINNRNGTYQGNVTYHLFEALGYDHMQIYKAPELPEYVKTFVNDCDEFEQKTRIRSKG